MDSNKLHLIACHIASCIVNETPADAIRAVEEKRVSSLLNKTVVKRGLVLANIPVVKDEETINSVMNDGEFISIFTVQLGMLVKNILRIYSCLSICS